MKDEDDIPDRKNLIYGRVFFSALTLYDFYFNLGGPLGKIPPFAVSTALGFAIVYVLLKMGLKEYMIWKFRNLKKDDEHRPESR